jgi:competence protein ComEA
VTLRILVSEFFFGSLRLPGRSPSAIISIQLSILLFIILISACSSRVKYALPEPTQIASTNVININAATVNDLERLPYIGRTTAEAIVAFRRDHGPFRRPEQLLLIRGISEPRFAEIRHLLTAR